MSENDHVDDLVTVKEWRNRGYKCQALGRTNLGFVNGYVTVPKGHPAYGIHQEDLNETIHLPHTILTCSSSEGKIGFDTCHTGDQWNTEELEKLGVYNPEFPEFIAIMHQFPTRTLWTLNLLTQEVQLLAEQLSQMQLGIKE